MFGDMATDGVLFTSCSKISCTIHIGQLEYPHFPYTYFWVNFPIVTTGWSVTFILTLSTSKTTLDWSWSSSTYFIPDNLYMDTSSDLLRRLSAYRRRWFGFFSGMAFVFYLLHIPGKTLICLHSNTFRFPFYASGCYTHLAGHIWCLLFCIRYLIMGDSSHLCSIFFHIWHLISHIFRGESPHLCHLLFLLSKYIFCLSEYSTPRTFCLIKFCINLVFRLSYFMEGIKPRLYHCLGWLLPCLRKIVLHKMHILTTVLTFSLYNLFQYINLFLVVVDGMLFIICLIIFISFEVLDLLLQICHYHLQYILHNDIVPFILVILLVWNGCILASNGCILAPFSPLVTLMFHLYFLTSYRQGFICG